MILLIQVSLIHISQKPSEVSHGSYHLFGTGDLCIIFEDIVLIRAYTVPEKNLKDSSKIFFPSLHLATNTLFKRLDCVL